jgi:group I intron endonuclease
MSYFAIYKTTNNINNKIYIGCTTRNSQNYIGSGVLLHKAIAKYGFANFTKDIIEICESFEQMKEREIYWIAHYDSRNRNVGYNIAKGGIGGDTMSNHPNKESIYTKVAQSNSLTQRGKPRGAQSATHRINKGNSLKGHKQSIEHILNNANSRKGYTHSKETIEKIRQSMKNKAISQKTIEKRQKRVIIDNVIYPSLKLAANALNVSPSTISAKVNSKRTIYNNYQFV